MIKQLTKLANDLDSKGLSKEADYLDGVIKRLAENGYPAGGDCTSFSTALEAARENVSFYQKAYDTICIDERKYDQACIDAQVELETAIDQFDQADDNHKQCVKDYKATYSG
jgi:hypothetical protein